MKPVTDIAGVCQQEENFMLKMEVIGISGTDRYTLRDVASGKNYAGVLRFVDVEFPPSVGDYILWDKANCTDPEECRADGDLLRRYYGPYTERGYMRKGNKIAGIDVIVVVKESYTYLLHRYYG